MSKRPLKGDSQYTGDNKPAAKVKGLHLPRKPSPGMKPYTRTERTRIKHWINSIPFAVEQYRAKLLKTAEEYLTAMQNIGKEDNEKE